MIILNALEFELNSKGEVGIAVRKSIHTRVGGIIKYVLHSYFFSNNGISMKSTHYICHPYL